MWRFPPGRFLLNESERRYDNSDVIKNFLAGVSPQLERGAEAARGKLCLLLSDIELYVSNKIRFTFDDIWKREL